MMTWQDNSRALTGWRAFLCGWGFGEYRWVRQLIGGRWERWHVSVLHSDLWHPVSSPGGGLSRPSVICYGTPLVEEWPDRVKSGAR